MINQSSGTLEAKVVVGALLPFLAIASATPAHAQDLPIPPVRPIIDDNGVSLKFGDYTMDLPQLRLGDGDFSMTLIRNWVNRGWRDSFIGNMSWSGSVADGTMIVSIGNRSSSFAVNAITATTYYSKEGDGSILTFNGSTEAFTYTARDGTIGEFLPTAGYDNPNRAKYGRLSRIIRPNGEVMDFTSRSSAGGTRLQSVKSSLGYQVKYKYQLDIYDPDMKQIWLEPTSVQMINNLNYYCDPSASSCSVAGQSMIYGGYSFDTMRYQKDPLESHVRFDFNTSKNLSVISSQTDYAEPAPNSESPPYPSKISLQYDPSRYISGLTKPSGTWNYSYAHVITGTGILEETVVRTNPDSSQRTTVINKSEDLVLSETDELGRVMSYSYDSYGRMTKATSPEGDYVEYSYDGRGNVLQSRSVAKPGSGLADIVMSATYSATCANFKTCNKPLTVTDARGNATDYTYDTTHGGVLTKTGPAGAGGVRPQTRYSYTARYPWSKNSAGTLVQSATPIWVLTQESFCRTGATSGSGCAIAGDEVITGYDYGAPATQQNLLLRGTTVTADGETLRTCYRYDELGRKISETKPAANLTSCP